MKVKYGAIGDWDIYVNVDPEVAKLLEMKKVIKPTPKPKSPSVRGKHIKRVIYNDPATIIIWDDDTKTIAKCEEGDVYDREKGFYICLLKRLLGNKTTRGLINTHYDEWSDPQITIKDLNF